MEETMSRRERKKLQSRNKILDTAVELFKEKGFQSTSISDIMNGADLGIGTFYNYFSSKEDILLNLLNRMATEIQDRHSEMRQQGLANKEILPAMVLMVAHKVDENRFVLPLLLSTAHGANKGREAHPPVFMHMFLHMIEDGQRKGEFRQDVSVGLIAEMFHSLFQVAACSRLQMSFEENIAAKLKILMEGICVSE